MIVQVVAIFFVMHLGRLVVSASYFCVIYTKPDAIFFSVPIHPPFLQSNVPHNNLYSEWPPLVHVNNLPIYKPRLFTACRTAISYAFV